MPPGKAGRPAIIGETPAQLPFHGSIARVGPSPMTLRAQVGPRNREWWYLAPHQAAAGWFQTTSQDAPRGSPKPPYTRGSASPLGKSHGGSQSRGLHLTLLTGHTLQVCPSPCAPASQGPASRTSRSCKPQQHYTYYMYYLLSKLYNKRTANGILARFLAMLPKNAKP